MSAAISDSGSGADCPFFRSRRNPNSLRGVHAFCSKNFDGFFKGHWISQKVVLPNLREAVMVLKRAIPWFESWMRQWEKLKGVDIDPKVDPIFLDWEMKRRIPDRIAYEKAREEHRIAVINYIIAFATRHTHRRPHQERQILSVVKNNGISRHTYSRETWETVSYREAFFVCDRGVYFARINATSCYYQLSARFDVHIHPADKDVGLDHFIGATINVNDPIVVKNTHSEMSIDPDSDPRENSRSLDIIFKTSKGYLVFRLVCYGFMSGPCSYSYFDGHRVVNGEL
jgi:hypothetical protein